MRPDAPESEAEIARLRAEYARREREIGRAFYALDRPANLFLRHGQERALLAALRRDLLLPLADRRILEIGCGTGQWFATFEELGARRENLAGIDLDAGRLAEAGARFPGADLREGDASRLPWGDGAFDVVFQSTVFTSVLDPALRRALAAEMARALAPGGAIVWYDFRYHNPRNPNVRGVGLREVAELFPGFRVRARRVTLAPPLARALVPISWLAATALQSMALLNTHLLAVLRRTGG